MSNPETAKIIERLIACRDTLKVVERQYSVNLQPERAVMADAANALAAYDKTMDVIQEQPADLMAGRMRGLADRLDDASERCAARATSAKSQDLEADLLTRAYVYQECAGLIREALK